MLLTAAALTGNSQKRKEGRKKRAKQTLGEGYGTFTWPFYFKVLPDGAVDRAKVIYSTATLNCLITGVVRSCGCTVPITVLYATFEFFIGFCV